MNCTNVSPRKCNYLDLCISVYRGKFRVTLYDKRKDYSFNVISYPFLDGNIPKNLSYGVFISQLVKPPPRNLHRIVSIVNRSVKPNTRIDTQHPHFLIC